MHHSSLLAALVLAGLLAAACGTASEEPLQGPAVRADVSHFPGSPLSGPVYMDLASLEPDQGVLLHLTLIALDRLPGDALEPVGPWTRLITAVSEGNPVASVARLAAGARVGLLDDAGTFIDRIENSEWGRWSRVETFSGPLFEGTTTVFRAFDATGGPHAVEIQTYWNPGGRPELVLALEDLVEEAELREVLLMDIHNEAKQDALALLFRSPFRNSPARALAAVLEVDREPADDPALARCLEALRAMAPGNPEPPQRIERPGIESAMAQFTSAFSTPLEKRRALIYLAGRAHAPLTEDVALSAPDDVVDRFGAAVRDEGIESEDGLGWLLEHAAYLLLVALMNEQDRDPVLAGALAYYTGEVGRHAAILEEVVTAAASWDDLQARLVEENLIYLEDISPASRSRAFDWLAARGLAPPGYDPLAPIDARREALDRLEEAKGGDA